MPQRRGPRPSTSTRFSSPRRTCSPAVAALAIPGPALDLGDEQFGQVLGLPVQPGGPPGPRVLTSNTMESYKYDGDLLTWA